MKRGKKRFLCLVLVLCMLSGCASPADKGTEGNATPTNKPVEESMPTVAPTPTVEPTAEPTVEPTAEPTVAPTEEPAEPTPTPVIAVFVPEKAVGDEVVLADIYAARETDTLGVSSEILADKIKALGTSVHYFPSFDEIEKFLLENCISGDLLITMGAGNVVEIGESLLGL